MVTALLAFLAVATSFVATVLSVQLPACDANGLFSPAAGDPALRPDKSFEYFAYEGGSSELTSTLLLWPAQLPTLLFCLRGPQSVNDTKLAWFCAQDQSQWPSCIKEHCVLKPRLSMYEPTCGIAVNKDNWVDPQQCDRPWTVPKEDLSPAAARIYVAYYPFPKAADGGGPIEDSTNITLRITQSGLNEDMFRNLFCAFGPAPGASAQAAHGTLYCTRNPSQLPDCLQRYCTLDTTSMAAATDGSGIPPEDRFIIKCGLSLAVVWSKDCLDGKVLAPRFAKSMPTLEYYYFGNGDLRKEQVAWNGAGPFLSAEAGHLPSTLFCLWGTTPDGMDAEARNPWVCVYDIREWPSCVVKHCVFSEEKGSIIPNCNVMNDMSNQLDKTCDGNRWWIPTPAALKGSSRQSISFYDWNAPKDALTASVDKPNDIDQYSCVLGPEPSKPGWSPHGTWFCSKLDVGHPWPPCINSRCKIKPSTTSGSANSLVAHCASNIEKLGARETGKSTNGISHSH